MMNAPLYIFDLDGTLADGTHREHFITGDGKKDWAAYFAACGADALIRPVHNLMVRLQATGCEVRIWTGRCASTYMDTREWLARHHIHVPLTMRNEGDRTQDDVLKERWLMALSDTDRARLQATFEDRDRVVAMWRRNGVQCFQVREGAF